MNSFQISYSSWYFKSIWSCMAKFYTWHFFFINDIENEALNNINMFADDTSLYCVDHIGGVMVSVLASSVVDRGFKPRLGHTKDYKIGMCCFSAKHAALRRKSKNWLARNRNNVSEWSDISTRWLLFQWTSTIKIHGLVQSGPHHHFIEN